LGSAQPRTRLLEGTTVSEHTAPDVIPGPPPTGDHKDAKAQAKAAKAYAKATRPWFKKKRFILPLALVALIAAISVSSSGDDSTTTGTGGDTSNDAPAAGTADKKADAPKETLPGIGDKARDGKFMFTVTKVKPGVAQIGSKDFGVKAQGQFVLVTVKVKNIGDKAQTLFGDNQTLFINGKEYSADTTAAIYLDDSKSIFEEINPGNAINGVIVFDVPKSATAFQKIELHDSLFSSGVDVDLSKS
jgi:hypothetical protein